MRSNMHFRSRGLRRVSGDVRDGEVRLEAHGGRQRRGADRKENSKTSTGLGTALVGALAKQLKAQITEASSNTGLTVDITRSTFKSHLPVAA